MAIRHVNVLVLRRLTEADWKRVDAFKLRAYRLAQTRLSIDRTVSPISARICIDKSGFKFEGVLPPEPELVEHLAALRFFILKKEPSNVERLLSALGKHLDTQEARESLKWLRAQWTAELFGDSVSLDFNGKKLTSSYILDIWYNGHYFHGDEAKTEDLRAISALVTEGMAKYALVDAVYRATKAIQRIRACVDSLVRPEAE
jgi:hypothetical protein